MASAPARSPSACKVMPRTTSRTSSHSGEVTPAGWSTSSRDWVRRAGRGVPGGQLHHCQAQGSVAADRGVCAPSDLDGAPEKGLRVRKAVLPKGDQPSDQIGRRHGRGPLPAACRCLADRHRGPLVGLLHVSEMQQREALFGASGDFGGAQSCNPRASDRIVEQVHGVLTVTVAVQLGPTDDEQPDRSGGGSRGVDVRQQAIQVVGALVARRAPAANTRTSLAISRRRSPAPTGTDGSRSSNNRSAAPSTALAAARASRTSGCGRSRRAADGRRSG